MSRGKHDQFAIRALLDLGRNLPTARDEQQAARIVFAAVSRLWALDSVAMDRTIPERRSSVPVLHARLVAGTWTESQPEVPFQIADDPSIRLLGFESDQQPDQADEPPPPPPPPLPGKPGSPPSSSAMRVAIESGRCRYVLTLLRHSLPPFSPADLRTLRRLSDHCAGSFARLRWIEELRESEARLHALFDRSPDPALVTDTAGHILVLNEAARVLCQAPDPSLAGRKLEDIALPRERPRFAAALTQVAECGEAALEALVGTEAAIPVPIEFLFRRVATSGNATSILVTARDLTLQHRAREALRESEHRFEAVFRRSPTPMGLCRLASGTIMEVNDALANLLGYRAEELVGRTPIELGLLPAPAWDALAEAAAGTCATVRQEIQVPHPSGEKRDYIATLKQVQWAGESCALGTLIDISAQRKAEAELRQLNSELQKRVREGSIALQDTEAHYRALFDVSADGILIIAADGPDTGRIVQANPAALAMTGFSRDEICSMRLQDLDLGESPNLRTECFRRVLAGEQLRFEVRQRRKNGSFIPVEANVSKFVVGDKAFLVGFGRDVTERNRMESSLRETEKLAATGRVAASIAHEINNPLGTIWNSLWLLQETIPSDAPNRRQFDLIRREMQRVIRIVEQMLTLYRPAMQRATEFSLTDLIDSTIELWAPKMRNAEVSITHEAPAAPIRANLPQGPVSQILVNLVANALEACPRGGRIVVRSTLSGNELEVSVTDSGPGVPPEIAGRIFEPFFSTKNSHSGTGLGLGLAVSRSLAESMGGTLDYVASGRTGASFVLKLRQDLALGATTAEVPKPLSVPYHETPNEHRR